MKEAGRNLEFEMVVELGDGEVIFVVGGSLYPPVFVYERKNLLWGSACGSADYRESSIQDSILMNLIHCACTVSPVHKSNCPSATRRIC